MVAANPLLPVFWAEALASTLVLAYLLQIIVNGLTEGCFAFLKLTPGDTFPTVASLISLPPAMMGRRSWGVYLRLGIPLRPGILPLVYVGSATGACGLWGRPRSHISNMRTCKS